MITTSMQTSQNETGHLKNKVISQKKLFSLVYFRVLRFSTVSQLFLGLHFSGQQSLKLFCWSHSTSLGLTAQVKCSNEVLTIHNFFFHFPPLVFLELLMLLPFEVELNGTDSSITTAICSFLITTIYGWLSLIYNSIKLETTHH